MPVIVQDAPKEADSIDVSVVEQDDRDERITELEEQVKLLTEKISFCDTFH